MPGWCVGIVVPARNEEDSIEACVASILASCRQAPIADYWVVVVADSCTDATASRARQAVGEYGMVIRCNGQSAGTARGVGVEAVLERYARRESSRVWLANTDADTTVPPDWLEVQLGIADTGVTGVAGIVRLEENGCAAAHELYRTTYLTHANGTHAHVHGANLSMRADAYLDAGGWSNRPLAEDHCLWGRLKQRGWPLSSTVSSVVVTSARLIGRACGGFADTLKSKIDEAHAEPV
jgi:cellulose synthase/poly-beta-1,6-N-acetylglucosamine synthase-like glycosyltransferase